MDRIPIYILCLLFILSGCKIRKEESVEIDLSNEIYKVQKEVCGNKDYLKIFEHNRYRVSWMKDIDKMSNDTIYLLERHYYSDEVIPIQHKYYAMLWNRKEAQTIHLYNMNNGNIESFIDKPQDNDILYHLVNDWDTVQIKKGAIYEKSFGGDNNTVVTRIIIDKNNKHIESLCFKDFF